MFSGVSPSRDRKRALTECEYHPQASAFAKATADKRVWAAPDILPGQRCAGTTGKVRKNAFHGSVRDIEMSCKQKSWNDVEIVVVGAGTMGASIAQAYAQNGFTVGLLDISDEILEKAKATIAKELDSARRRIFTDDEIKNIQSRILTTTEYPKACGGDSLKLVVESATENIDLKLKIFKQLDDLCDPSVLIATNTSSLNVNLIAEEVKHPERIVWMHYFYLPHKNRAGEVAGADSASKESIEKALYFMKMAGKCATPILSSRKGGAADILFVALLLEACRMVDEGYEKVDVEAAGCQAFSMPLGFLGLMDVTGIQVGLSAMDSFADDSNPDDSLFGVYKDFFRPTESYRELCKEQMESADPSMVRWIPPEGSGEKSKGKKIVTELKERFLAVAFATSFECVESGVITADEFEKLARNAFLWRKGPFTIFNDTGVADGWRMVEERARVAKKLGHHFPIPSNLKKLAEGKNKKFKFDSSPVEYKVFPDIKAAWITLNSPQTANAIDNDVIDELEEAFEKANKDKDVRTIVFDTAPIKTFIAGANVPSFVENIEKGKFKDLKKNTKRWQDVIFHKMTGSGKQKVAIIDGQAFGGGVEIALAFAWDPDTTVIATQRTGYTLPETRLGIYPGLRGTLTMSRIIHRERGDEELAVAMARYYILAGGTPTTSPRLIKYFGFADLLVPSNKRDDVAREICAAIDDNNGKPLGREKLASLGIKELCSDLTMDEAEEIRVMRSLFLSQDLIPTLYAYGRRQAEIFHTSPWRERVQRVAKRVATNSPNAVWVSNWLIGKGFDDYMNGIELDDSAEYELDNYLIEIFKHPDAYAGLKALVERKFPEFRRRFPF